MKLSGGQIIAELLKEQGVDTVFGYPGGAALLLYDALYDYKSSIKHILTSHEQGAAHAADGYSRSTGKTGVVIATSGPGATNLVTGIATAFMDSVPMIAITINVAGNLIGRDAFQETCITGVTMPITKHNYFINKPEMLIPSLREAFTVANTGRKGPVLIDITKDVTIAEIEYEFKKAKKIKTSWNLPKENELKNIANVINSSKKPLIYVGGGVRSSKAEKELQEILAFCDIPIAYSLMAAGSVGYENPRSLGMLGMHGTIAANTAVSDCDMLLALGTRFSDRAALNTEKFAKKATKIQVDLDASEIDKNIVVDYGVVSDIKAFLKALKPHLMKKTHKDWRKLLDEKKKITGDVKTKYARLHPREIISSTCKLTDKETIYVTDVGQHQMWTAQFLRHENTKNFITSGGLGTMGFGYGAAIGSQIGNPHKRVIHITGDASFHMNMTEAATAVSQNLPIITIVMNNRVLGMVYQWQASFCKKRFSSTEPERSTDFVKLAEGFGASGYKASTLEEFEAAFKKALSSKGPVWIECEISKNEKVLPMIPNQGTIDDIIIG
ncbi:MAG: biosynthetic-type acetolactate synthase large subunit [Anaerovoracaceae bacterium]